MTWEDRLRVCLGISRLMVYLSESPLGSLAIHDYKLSQFITVDGEIKLADLDDVDNNHSPCSTSSECSIDMGTNITLYTSCSNEVCSNFSQKSNMAHSYLKFFVFLQLEQPPGMSELIGQFINNTKKILWSPRQCLQHMQTILSYYKQGKYIDQGYTSNINDSHFRVYHDHTADQGEEYWCPGTRQLAATCVLSVHDENEAITICLRDRQCVAFVLTPERTWTGRYIAHFKKAISMMSIRPSKGNTLFVFPTL
ncbi:extracellular tyrosine-protein kinase PKDCC-like [Lytechinus variegatus]|uniref:extracellular tyrosine-protein kinase PKDCC-like n=1 Tax=Lytechinus variegatus TaxID=7654 RepID=UPI001BB1FA2B|nr:extracellular tyrosine-protein kinase PKDCC-like [Lytechinus variegatus]